jgi:hypothetical protein
MMVVLASMTCVCVCVFECYNYLRYMWCTHVCSGFGSQCLAKYIVKLSYFVF